jgi:hypothetical protein
MADAGLFIGWGAVARGREKEAVELFNEILGYYGQLQEEGEIESFEPVFLEPHGGDLGGFFPLWGERDKIAQLRASDELNALFARAQLIVENFGVVGAETGDRIGVQMQLFLENSTELA